MKQAYLKYILGLMILGSNDVISNKKPRISAAWKMPPFKSPPHFSRC